MVCLRCYHCESELIHRDGFNSNGKQRYRCRACGRRSTENPNQGLSGEREAQVWALLNERMSQRGIARALKMSRVSVAAILKKKPKN